MRAKPLSKDAFKRRYQISSEERDDRFKSHVSLLLSGDLSGAMLSQVPMRLRLDMSSRKGKSCRDECEVLEGCRLLQVARTSEYPPKLLYIWSPLTRMFHAVGGADQGQFVSALGRNHLIRLDNWSLLGDNRTPVSDNDMRTALLIDNLITYEGVESSGLNSGAFLKDGSLLGNRPRGTDGSAPSHLRLLRYLRTLNGVVDNMLKTADEYGLPNNVLGEALAHADKFRTL